MMDPKSLYQSGFNPLLIQPSRPLPKEIAVIGAGTIGPDIGYYLKSALPSSRLYLVDVVESQLKAAEERLKGYTQKALEKKKLKEEKAKEIKENIVYTLDYKALKDCELVIEAATESIPLKQKIFQSLEEIVSPEAIITSNTSSIPADRIFSQMKRPERATITHFFAPAWRSLPVEVIKWEKVSKEVLDYLFWFFCETGKCPIITDNVICFMLDRIFDNWCNEAAYLLNEATASQIDKVAEEFVQAGPFYVLNLANGNPIIVETNTLQMEEGECYKPANILKSVKEWNTHRPGAKVDVDAYLKNAIRDRLLGILFSQSFDIVDRGIGTKEDLNLGCQIALGFKEGPLELMARLGEDEVQRIMKRFASERPGFPKNKDPIGEYTKFKRFILVDRIEDVIVITIRRPQAMNALNPVVTGEILEVFQTYHDDPSVTGFVLTGYGKQAFSAGADIGTFPEVLGKREAAIEHSRTFAKVQLYMDQMKKPMVAALNGYAMGGGLEVAIRCHEMLSTQNALLQFPEVTLGILPGIGGCVVPYRKWPQAASVFHEMICLARPLRASEAFELGIIKKICPDYSSLIAESVKRVRELKDDLPKPIEGPVKIPEFVIPDEPKAGNLPLSKEVVEVIWETIRAGANADTLNEALEIGYKGFGKLACMEAAREGVSAFLEKRRPVFKK
ncbi:MAG: 3-hydroxyacyl-CoA dehydrogenase NAD-binding domain-containing protein [Desulfatiglandales bacterium]